ncbi:MAG: pantetheine-phosphate adenylyltransferase [Nitrososphaerota archaeon]|nr:pantetheine-phosphate adenylyltransferase [Nitrososphaerota archaeon]
MGVRGISTDSLRGGETLKFRTVATGGTFDHIHKGHVALLAKSFEVGDKVVIGVTSDEFAKREGKIPDQDYRARVDALEALIKRMFPGRDHVIAKLDDYFGPGIASPEIEAIVVSRETAQRVPIANDLRLNRGFAALEVVVVDYVLADDSKPISSTRIRKGEIDSDGRVSNGAGQAASSKG